MKSRLIEQKLVESLNLSILLILLCCIFYVISLAVLCAKYIIFRWNRMIREIMLLIIYESVNNKNINKRMTVIQGTNPYQQSAKSEKV